MSAADSAHHRSDCIATTEHMPTPTLTDVEIRRTDGSLHTSDWYRASYETDLQTPCPIFKYVDDTTVFDVCSNTNMPMLQKSTDIQSIMFEASDRSRSLPLALIHILARELSLEPIRDIAR